ncbi:hypothetical protein MNBD_GAMMA25-1751 [hydrothermal vent metagenome]|uniref:Sigma factor RpoE regulatory protein RseC n=1 Tax=hydrothermal vent metagenome TaxID=652676 RepID=A0A3B1BDQ6_9ZZZZ
MSEAMIEESGTVIAIDGAFVEIEIQLRSSCGHCQVSDSCGTSVLASLFNQRRNTVRLLNHFDSSVGDEVIIGITESVLLSAALMAYMLPLLLMIVFASFSALYGFSDGINFIFGMLGLFMGMTISKRIMAGKNCLENSAANLKGRAHKGLSPWNIVLLRKANYLNIKMD